jgi:hypothetical protein
MAKGVKTGGRKAGTPNKEKRELISLLKERYPDYHPVVAMAEIANDDTEDTSLRFQAHKEVAQYVEPKRKSVELSNRDGETLKIDSIERVIIDSAKD